MKNSLVLFAVILAVFLNQAKICMAKVPEDAKLTTPELIKKYGYPVEIHTITTSDGYVLTVHRIPPGGKCRTKKKKPILLQHGIMGSSADWIIVGPEKGLGYILADAGYDIWLANSRGNRYSRNHTHLNPNRNRRKFWNFSWHEIGIYDLPAIIDYIIKLTEQEKILYIGYSQGTTVYFVMASEKPEYNNKVAVAISLAPIAFMKNMYSPILRVISTFQGVLEFSTKWIGSFEFLPHSKLISIVTSPLCGDDAVFQILCSNAVFSIIGFNKKQMNATLIPIMSGHLPAGASSKQILHYAQLHKSGKFRQFDHGVIKNLKYYGAIRPPNYKLNKVSTPMYMYYSKNDWLSHEKDVNKLASKLGKSYGKYLVANKKFNHGDYLYGIDAPTLIFKRIIKLIADF